MGKTAAERFGPPAELQRETQAVRDSLHRHQTDPEPGHRPADVQEAVRQDQRGIAQTPVITQNGEDKDLQVRAESMPDLPKHDSAEKTGPTPETRPAISPDAQKELNDIGATLDKNGVKGGEEYQIAPVQEANQPAVEPKETAADRYGDKPNTPPEPQPEMEPEK